jgi:hypothetical protein
MRLLEKACLVSRAAGVVAGLHYSIIAVNLSAPPTIAVVRHARHAGGKSIRFKSFRHGAR